MILITTTGLGLVLLGTCVLLPVPLAILANNRAKKPVPWALLGAIPLVNVVALIILLWTPLPSDLANHQHWHDQWDELEATESPDDKADS